MNTYAVDIQAAAAVAPFNVAVTAPEGFDQAVRRALRKLEDSGAHRVLAVRPTPSEYDSHAYEVEVQATAAVRVQGRRLHRERRRARRLRPGRTPRDPEGRAAGSGVECRARR